MFTLHYIMNDVARTEVRLEYRDRAAALDESIRLLETGEAVWATVI
jgi:hypothetical protein